MILLIGLTIAFSTIRAPTNSSPSKLSSAHSCKSNDKCVNVAPPPGTIPSSTAALVALIASSKRSFLSFISVSVAAPTLIIATPPANFASLSCNFSLS